MSPSISDGDDLAVPIIALGVVRQKHAQAVLDRDARARRSRKPREKCLLPGCRTALTVCQAISIAMTVVLPAPVASFSARRISSGLACSFAPLDVIPEFGAARARFRRDFGQPDGGFDGLDLAEERA